MTAAAEATGLEDRLTLADWRRRVVALYAEVREKAATDPEDGWNHWRATREWLFKHHPQSPVPAARRATFTASHWPYDPGLRFEARATTTQTTEMTTETPATPVPGTTFAGFGAMQAVSLPNSGDDQLGFTRIGRVEIPFPGRPRTLPLFWLHGYGGGLFLPFRDGTSGSETYGAGRYLLDAAKSADLGGDIEKDTLVIDFNFAYQPSCAWDPRWACPLAPPESRLDIPIRAGEHLGGWSHD